MGPVLLVFTFSGPVCDSWQYIRPLVSFSQKPEGLPAQGRPVACATSQLRCAPEQSSGFFAGPVAALYGALPHVVLQRCTFGTNVLALRSNAALRRRANILRYKRPSGAVKYDCFAIGRLQAPQGPGRILSVGCQQRAQRANNIQLQRILLCERSEHQYNNHFSTNEVRRRPVRSTAPCFGHFFKSAS